MAIGGGVSQVGGKVSGVPVAINGVPSQSGSGAGKAGGSQPPANPQAAANYGMNKVKSAK